MRNNVIWGVLLLGSVACGLEPPTHVGGNWYVDRGASTGVIMESSMLSDRRVLRKTSAGMTPVGVHVYDYRYYEPDCVVFAIPDGRRLLGACGDGTPIELGSSLALPWTLGPEGPTRALRLELRGHAVVQIIETIPVARVAQGRVETVMSERAVDARATDDFGETALFEAIRGPRYDPATRYALVEALLAAGADPHARNKSDLTALMLAKTFTRPDEDRLLVRLAEAERQGARGR